MSPRSAPPCRLPALVGSGGTRPAAAWRRVAAIGLAWVLGSAAAVAIPALAQQTAAATPTPPAASGAAAARPTHRPLRENRPAANLPATEPEVFDSTLGAPPFSVLPRQQALALFPCSQCHKVLPLNTQVRKLEAAPHQAALRHGKGRMWCLDCHMGTDRDVLHSINGTPIGFNASYQLCGQCHSARQRDWAFGAHGKRVAGWQGERQLYACTHCHDPHNPLLQGRAPAKPPPVRAGLLPMQPAHDTVLPLWQRVGPAQPDMNHAQTSTP